MSKKLFSDYSDEELDVQLKKAKLFYGIFIGLIITMIVISLFTVYSKKISFNTFLPLFFLPMLFVYHNQIKAIKKEIASRK